MLTGGSVAEGPAQLPSVTEPSRDLIADKTYDADHLHAFLQARSTLVVIPNKINRVNHYPFDREKYKSRNVIERTIGRIKDFRAPGLSRGRLLQPDTTRQLTTSSPASVWQPSSSGGSTESIP